MQGQIIEFSMAQGIGKIASYCGKQQFVFSYSQWMAKDLPKLGQSVDFEVNQRGHAMMITTLSRTTWTHKVAC